MNESHWILRRYKYCYGHVIWSALKLGPVVQRQYVSMLGDDTFWIIKQRRWRMCVCATIRKVSLLLSNMPYTATPAKALVFYSHTPLGSTDQVPCVHELCMRGCSGQLMLELGIDTTRRGNLIQLLGLGGCDSIQQVRQLLPRSKTKLNDWYVTCNRCENNWWQGKIEFKAWMNAWYWLVL